MAPNSDQIESAKLLVLLNSCGGRCIEADIRLQSGGRGRGAAATFLHSGRREPSRSILPGIGEVAADHALSKVASDLSQQIFGDQAAFDRWLLSRDATRHLGADVMLALSLAFARASAKSLGLSLVRHIWGISKLERAPALPQPLINIISGGIHAPGGKSPFQQLMVFPVEGDVLANISEGMEIYRSIEAALKSSALLKSYSSSSGLIADFRDWRDAIDMVARRLASRPEGRRWRLGLDIAADHLFKDGSYCWDGERFGRDQWIEKIVALTADYSLGYLEDPVDSADSAAWSELHARLAPTTLLIGDDLFVSHPLQIVSGMATGILLKLNQARTLTTALAAAESATAAGLQLCVSHRSCEVEDTAMCDYAVAIGAKLLKIGGPRRGDRIANYNRMIRLYVTGDWGNNGE